MASTSYYGGGRLNFTGGGRLNFTGGGYYGGNMSGGGGDNTTGGSTCSTSYYGGANMSGGKRGGKTSGTGNTVFMEWVAWKKAKYPNGGYTKAEVSKAWAAHKKKMGIKTKK